MGLSPGRGRACPARRFARADVCGWLPGGWVLAGGFAGRRGRRPLRVARERAAAGGRPSSGPAGPPSPEGEGKGCRGGIHPSRGRAAAGGRGGVGAPRPTDGDMETLWGLRGHPFPGRRSVGAGHARPGGLRRQASMVRSVGRGLDPSAGGYPGDGCWRKVSRGVGDAAPYGLPGEGRQRKPPPTSAAGPRCGAGGSGCSTSGLTKPALYRRNLGRCRGGSRR